MIKRGDIVLLSFPFTDLRARKVRPALVVSSNSFNRSQDAIFVFITAKEYTGQFNIRIEETDPSFQTTKLKTASTLRISKLMCLEQKLAIRRLGHADKHILNKVNTALKSLFELSH